MINVLPSITLRFFKVSLHFSYRFLLCFMLFLCSSLFPSYSLLYCSLTLPWFTDGDSLRICEFSVYLLKMHVFLRRWSTGDLSEPLWKSYERVLHDFFPNFLVVCLLSFPPFSSMDTYLSCISRLLPCTYCYLAAPRWWLLSFLTLNYYV